MAAPAPSFLATPVRQRALEFLMDASLLLAVAPVVKYTALSLFTDRFLPSLPRILVGAKDVILAHHETENASLKALGDRHIRDQHFTLRDFVEACNSDNRLGTVLQELVFLKVLRFEIGTSNVVFIFLEELLIQFRQNFCS
ncbi:hypothetical protein Taro_043179 [Colocasia esculenta]|uniref:Uncharacterized protein n=1 Tax=Colocasia esculenta TaxID=4460 RepID=A0A843WQQ9_COLES|nr:hypothetical protein [Colocasia esculenta]